MSSGYIPHLPTYYLLPTREITKVSRLVACQDGERLGWVHDSPESVLSKKGSKFLWGKHFGALFLGLFLGRWTEEEFQGRDKEDFSVGTLQFGSGKRASEQASAESGRSRLSFLYI